MEQKERRERVSLCQGQVSVRGQKSVNSMLGLQSNAFRKKKSEGFHSNLLCIVAEVREKDALKRQVKYNQRKNNLSCGSSYLSGWGCQLGARRAPHIP